jgi:hypothetical protein
MLANPIVLAVVATVALVTAFTVLYFKVKQFRDFINHWGFFGIAFWMTPIGQLAVMFYLWNHVGTVVHALGVAFKHVVNFLQDIVHYAKQAYHWISKLSPQNWLKKVPGGSFLSSAFKYTAPVIGPINVARKLWSWAQEGGTVVRPGLTMVGEGGPELLHLPRAAQVSPLERIPGVGSLQLTIIPADVKIDGQRVAQIVFSHQTAVNARA